MKLTKSVFAIVACFYFISNSVCVYAITPQEWMSIELDVRQLTVNGMELRLTQLQQGAPKSEQLDSDASIQQAISQAFISHGTTAADHQRWKYYNKKELTKWLAENQEQQERLTLIERRYELLVDSMSNAGSNQ